MFIRNTIGYRLMNRAIIISRILKENDIYAQPTFMGK